MQVRCGVDVGRGLLWVPRLLYFGAVLLAMLPTFGWSRRRTLNRSYNGVSKQAYPVGERRRPGPGGLGREPAGPGSSTLDWDDETYAWPVKYVPHPAWHVAAGSTGLLLRKDNHDSQGWAQQRQEPSQRHHRSVRHPGSRGSVAESDREREPVAQRRHRGCSSSQCIDRPLRWSRRRCSLAEPDGDRSEVTSARRSAVPSLLPAAGRPQNRLTPSQRVAVIVALPSTTSSR